MNETNLRLEEKTWTVVKFVGDQTVEAVPTIWIQNGRCLWPTIPSHKISTVISNYQIDNSWPLLQVDFFKNATYGSYEIARQKAVKAETTSDLNSTDDSESENIRKIIPNKKFVETSSDSEMETPKAESLRKKNTLEKMKTNQPRKSKPSFQRTVTPSNIEPLEYAAIMNDNEITPDAITESNTPIIIFEETLEEDMNTSTLKDISTDVTVLNLNDPKICKCCPIHKEQGQNAIMKQIFFLRSMIADLGNQIKELKIESSANKNINLDEGSSVFIDHSLPVQNEESLFSLENSLEDQIYFNKAVKIQEICIWGGSNLLDMVKRSLGSLISNNLAIQYSWLGRRTKKKFQNLNIAKLIIQACIKSGKASEEKMAEQEIARWLRRAPDRLKKN